MTVDLPEAWRGALAPQFSQPYFKRLAAFVDDERSRFDVYPPESDVFNAFCYSDLSQTRVLILGQDPYHDAGQAHGLSFSVRAGVRLPASLRNIFAERQADIGLAAPPPPISGDLTPWANQGVLMLNTVLTVRAHQANSHKGAGWETFTDAVIRAVSARESPAVFVLWGGHAQKKRYLIDLSRHAVIESAHPSPLSARNGFFGSRPFSRINAALAQFAKPPIDWRVAGEA